VPSRQIAPTFTVETFCPVESFASPKSLCWSVNGHGSISFLNQLKPAISLARIHQAAAPNAGRAPLAFTPHQLRFLFGFRFTLLPLVEWIQPSAELTVARLDWGNRFAPFANISSNAFTPECHGQNGTRCAFCPC